jgi:hypothetical protein
LCVVIRNVARSALQSVTRKAECLVQYCIVVHVEITAAADMCLRVPFHIQSPPETVDDQRRRDVAVWALGILFVYLGGSSMAEAMRKQGHTCAPISAVFKSENTFTTTIPYAFLHIEK